MKRVFCYLRVSTASQIGGDGFDRQLETCKAFCARNGWVVARVFSEQQSGSDEWSDRKLLSEAMELASAEAGTVDTIVVERADRLSRDLAVAEMFLRACKERGIKVYAADCGEEMVNATGDPTRTLIRQVLSAVSQWDKSVLVKKMLHGRKKKAEDTKMPCGGPQPNPYGDRGTLAQQNEERRIIKDILAMYCSGMSYRAIAKRLTNARIKNPNGNVGRRVSGVNPPFVWGYNIVARLVKTWEGREL